MKNLFLVSLLILCVLSQNTVDYWVDLTNSGAHVSVGASDYGRDGQLSVSWVFRLANTAGWRQVFHSYSNLANDGADPLRLGVAINGGATFGLHIGTSFYQWPMSSGVPANTDTSMTMDLVNSGANLIITVFKNNAQVLSASIPNESIGAGIRVNTIIGAYRYSSGQLVNLIGAGTNTFLDNFIILTKVSTSAFRGSLFAQLWKPTADVQPSIRLWLSFDDTVSGIGTSTVAITSAQGAESLWVEGEFKNGAAFKQHVNENMDYCYGWGDPHIYRFGGGAHWGPGEGLNGHYLMVGCDEADYEFRTFSRYVAWWGATVYRSVAVRFRDYVLRYNLDEASGYGGGSPLGVASGAYYKQLHETSWTGLPGSSSYVFWKDSGMYYYYTGSGFGTWIPGVAQMTLSTPDGRYMNINAWFNTLNTNCPRTGTASSDGRGYVGAEGYCYGDIWYRNVEYNDWLPPPPHQDIPIPTDPCADVDSTLVTKIEDSCKRIYPSNQDLYSDCRMDGCSSGDPEIIPFTTPTPECQIAKLLGKTTECTTLNCPNQCSYRGTCNSGTCQCDQGWVGKDCGQPKYFGCQSFTYGGIETSVSTLHMLNTKTQTFGGANLVGQMNALGIERSLLFYPVFLDNMYYLFAVASAKTSPYAGSFRLCFNAAITVNQIVGISVSQNANCFDVSFSPYQQGGVIFELGSGPTPATYTVAVSLKNNIDQVLFGSADGVREIQIAKIPTSYHSGFTYKVDRCDSEVCSNFDKCSDCAAQPQCGYCLESGRCMLGSPSGPLRGVCRNWRFTYDEAISRVVTVDYTGLDIVNPDYELFLSSTTSDDVSTSIFVPTGSSNYQWDVAFYFQTTGTYAIYASTIKNNFIKTIESSTYTSMNLNLAIGNYDQTKTLSTQPMTRLSINNHYVFARALETGSSTGADLQGGQIGALSYIAGASGVNLGWRKYAKKLAVLTVYDTPAPGDQNKLEATKNALVKQNILPVFVVMGANADATETYFRNLANDVNGFPSVIIRMDEAASDFSSVLARIFSLGSSVPYIALDKVNDDLVHLDQVLIDANRDLLYFTGLTHPSTKARFILPMKRGDGNHHKAKIRVPGYGEATIVDVDNGKPSGAAQTVYGKENSPCIPFTLKGTTFKNLLPPVFHFVSTVPSAKGDVFVFDASLPGANGAKVTDGSYHAKNSFCFRPPVHQYSFPVGTIFTSLTYYVSDGCANSDNYVVDLIVNPVLEPPASQDYVIPLFEGDTLHNFTIEASEYDRDLVSNNDETVSFAYKYIASFNRPDLFSKVDTTASLREQATLNPVSFTTAYGPLTTTNNKVSQSLTYTSPSDDFFGQINYGFTVSDSQGLSSNYKITFDITPINDHPVPIYEPIVATNEDTPLTVTLAGFDVDNTGATITYKLVSLKAGSVKYDRTNAILTVGTEYTYTETTSHKVTVPLTLTPAADDNNCPTGTPFKTCPGSYAVIQFKVNDNNKEYRTSKADATVVAAETQWQTMTIHVIAVNDRPTKPANKVLNLVEDQFDNVMTLTADDIDTVAASLDVYIEHLPSYKSLHLFQRLAGGAKGAEITADTTELNDYSKKRFSQDHGLIVSPDANVHGVNKADGFFFDSFTYYSFDEELRSDSATVSVYIRPVNDAPVPVSSVSFLEDNEFNFIFEAGDVDNLESELTYVITALPDVSVAEEGVNVFYVDSTGARKQLTATDLPFTVTRVNGRASVVLSPKLNWFGNTTLTYTTTDKDNFLASGDQGYKVNTVTTSLNIEVVPVNDAPVLRIDSPIGNEDTPIVVLLAGDDEAWGEDDTLEAILESDLYDGNGRTGINLGKLYKYTPTLFAQLSSDINNLNGAVEVNKGSVIDATYEYKVIYVPRQHKNTETSLSHLAMSPWFDYRIHESDSQNDPKGLSSPVGSVKIVVQSVNDAPVAWGNKWDTIAEYDSVYGITGGSWNNPQNPTAAGSQTENCYGTCFYFEDFNLRYPSTPVLRGILMGGHDVELSDLTVVIVDAVCPDTIEIFYTQADGTEKQLKNTDLKGWRFPQTIAPGSLSSVLQFRPAMDDFNAENPDENRGGRPTDGGHKGSSYCTITYEVRDEDDVPSVETKTITITVMQKNDIPREKLVRPKDNTNNNAQIDMTNFVVNSVTGFEDIPVIFKLDAYDVEGDDFTVKIFECDPDKGKFYGPAVDQHKYINDNGELELPQDNPLTTAFSTTPIDCLAARAQFETLSTKFSETQKKGWYMLFIPSPNDYGTNYNKLNLIYDDGISPIDKIYGTFRFINILPVNDAPEIWINSPANGSLIPISYDDNSIIILDPLNFKDDIHVDGTENLGTTIDSSFNFGLKFQDDDAADAPNIDFEIVITKRPAKEQNEDMEAGYFIGFPDNVPGATVKADSLKWTSTIEQANKYVATLAFVGSKQGEYQMTVTVHDNGYTGKHCPPGPNFSLGQRSCPRTSVATFTITAYVNYGAIAGIATGVGGGVLLLAALGAFLGAKFLKPKDTDAWTEWDVDNFGDVALPNPLFKGETVTGTSQIYQNQ